MFNQKKVLAILAAAGTGARMGLPYNKLFYPLGNKTVIERTLLVFESCPFVDKIIIAANKSDMEHINKTAGEFSKVLCITEGGETRQETIRKALSFADGFDKIVIHDAARPFVTEDIIKRALGDSEMTGAAAVGIKAVDTIKQEDGNGFAEKTPDRKMLWQIQTPQVFDADILKKAHSEGKAGATDDAMLAESIGVKVKLTNGSRENIKITTPEDLIFAKAVLEMQKEMRIGHGYDAHRLVEGRPLYMGGVLIPHSKGLLGHSDADVLLHAISDALLGAAAMGDIGKHFPPSDDKYKGISNIILLREVKNIIAKEGYYVNNVDATIVAQKPKMAGYIPQMVKIIGGELGTENISIKATTTEGMGFEGREEGISATAVCTVFRRMVNNDKH